MQGSSRSGSVGKLAVLIAGSKRPCPRRLAAILCGGAGGIRVWGCDVRVG